MILDIQEVDMYTLKPIVKNIVIEQLVYAFDTVRPPHFYFSGEAHDFWEILFIDYGEITATADERIYRLDGGKLLFHKPMEFHRVWTDDKPARILTVSFTASGPLMEYFKNSCFDLTPTECEKFSRVSKIFIKARRLYKKGEMEEYSFASNMAAVLLEEFLLSLINKPIYSQKHYSQSERQYHHIVNIMKENCESSLSVDDIAVLSNMSTSNMKRVFSLYSDIGIAKFFLNLKMNRARELLNNGISPTQISTQLGFNEVSYFYTVFKRETGMTPAEFCRTKI